MKTVRYDAAIFGDRDFLIEFPFESQARFSRSRNMSHETLQKIAKRASFPFLLSNVEKIKGKSPLGWEGIKQTLILQKGPIKVGLYGILMPSVAQNLAWSNF